MVIPSERAAVRVTAVSQAASRPPRGRSGGRDRFSGPGPGSLREAGCVCAGGECLAQAHWAAPGECCLGADAGTQQTRYVRPCENEEASFGTSQSPRLSSTPGDVGGIHRKQRLAVLRCDLRPPRVSGVVGAGAACALLLSETVVSERPSSSAWSFSWAARGPSCWTVSITARACTARIAWP